MYDLFIWFCEEHPEDAPEEMEASIQKVKINLSENKDILSCLDDFNLNEQKLKKEIIENNEYENYNIYEEFQDTFLEYFGDNKNCVFVYSIMINHEWNNYITRWYDYYFYHSTDMDDEGPFTLSEALDHVVIDSGEFVNDEIIHVDFNKSVLSWNKVQDLLTRAKPTIGSEIVVNDQEYIHIKKGNWVKKEQSY